MIAAEILHKFISKATRTGQGFALWFFPDEEIIRAIVHKNGDVIQTPANLPPETESGFVFSPFIPSDKYPTIILHPDHYLKGLKEIEDFVNDDIAGKIETPIFESNNIYTSTSYEDYIDGCESIINRIKNGRAEKVVYSRLKVVPDKGGKSPGELILSLKEKYPAAFCYLFYTPKTGFWMGATPETFLRKENSIIKTMALAGTRKRTTPENIGEPWPAKEIREQQYVSDFIKDELRKLGIGNLKISEPNTSGAGTIEHIRTDFEFSIEKNMDVFNQIIEALHPTPAVCGQSKNQALQIIRETENHDREYYTGFLGTYNIDEKIELFVNLRCSKITNSGFVLFVGGGITADSLAENEWEETTMKAKILGLILPTA